MFCLTVPKSFVRESFSVSFIPISNNNRDKRLRTGCTFFRRKYVFSQYRNILKKNPSVLGFRKFPVGKKVMDRRGEGVSTFSVEKFLFLKVPEK